MSAHRDSFYKRIRRITRQHSKLSGGYSLRLNKQNLIVAQPHFNALAFPWKALFVSALIALVLKAYIMAAMDAPTYAGKLDTLSQGHMLEQAGAWVMQPDPATNAVARVMRMMHG